MAATQRDWHISTVVIVFSIAGIVCDNLWSFCAVILFALMVAVNLRIGVQKVGPIVSTVIVAAVETGTAFRQARAMSAWLGLVRSQYSTGGKSNLGRMAKHGIWNR